MVEIREAAVGRDTKNSVSKIVYDLVRSIPMVSSADVNVVDDTDETTALEIVAIVQSPGEIGITRAVLRSRFAQIAMTKDVFFDLLVREEGLAGDASETVWRLGRHVIQVEGAAEVPRRAEAR